ncbi:MAG: hypothetical protein ACKV0T_12840 [Planctomycetales bacterium]
MKQWRAESFGARCGWLAAAVLSVWLLSLLPAFQFFGQPGLIASALAALVCLVPGCVLFGMLAGNRNSATELKTVLLATLGRTGFALGGAWVMHSVLGLSPNNYLVWLGLYYLVALSVETLLLMPAGRGRRQAV